MITHEVRPTGCLLAPDDDLFQRWVWRDTIESALEQVQSSAFADTAQLTTGIVCDESQLVSLLTQMDGRPS